MAAQVERQVTSMVPELQTKLDMNPTLIVSWFCTIFSLIVIVIRIIGRWVRTERLFREDKVMLWSIVPLMIRMALVHPVLIWGTNNTQTIDLSEHDIYHRSLGSRLVLASRVFYAIYIWVAKVAVLEFVRRIIATSWTRFYEVGARIIYYFLGLTLIGVIVSTLAECQPFPRYWQVVPDPGSSCRSGSTQLLTMGICDIITDVVLIIFPIPLVIMSKMPMLKKVSMVLLFLLSLILVAITSYRIPSTISRDYRQQYRSLLASLEILAATCVSNVIVIGSFLRDKGVKKVKYRAGSFLNDEEDGEGSILTRPATRNNKPSAAQRHWGSDEDLVRDFGLTLSAELRHETTTAQATRLAPTVEPATVPYQDVSPPQPTINPQGRGLLDPAWTFRKGSHVPHPRRGSDASSDSDSSTDFKLRNLEPYTDEPASPTTLPETPYKKMSFFDVGGLVDIAPSEHSSFDQPVRRYSNAGRSASVSRSGQNFIADVGGLLGPVNMSRPEEDRSLAPSSSSGIRSSNLLSPENTIRERSRSPFGHSMIASGSLRKQRRDSAETTPHYPAGPDALDISDAGGLLK